MEPRVAIRRRKVAQLWREGLSAPEIAERLGASESTVGMDLYFMRQTGWDDIPRRYSSSPPQQEHVTERQKRVAKLRRQGWTGPEIAEKLGEHPRRIDNDLRWLRLTGKIDVLTPKDHPERVKRRERIAELWLAGVPADDIALEVGVRRSTVYEDISRIREEGRDLPHRIPSLVGNRSQRRSS